MIETVKESPRQVLALNETRKTLLASRLVVARSRSQAPRGPILPGDGIWIERPRGVDPQALPVMLDLLFLDADHRVVAAGNDPHPHNGAGAVEEATAMLMLAPGTISASHTQPGDRILIEEIVVPVR